MLNKCLNPDLNPHNDQTSYEIEDIFCYMGSNIISSLLQECIKKNKAWYCQAQSQLQLCWTEISFIFGFGPAQPQLVQYIINFISNI